MKLNYLILVAALIFYTTTAAQVNAGQIDDFENGTIQNWTDGGSPVPPENISTGGPAGNNDNYLRNVSLGGNGAGSKMVMFNEQQWAGNYINEGIVAIKFDARAITNNLNLRVAFDGAGGRICTTNAVTVLAGGNWAQVVIPISTTDFTLVAGGSSILQTLADVSDIRILSNTTPSWQGESIAATLEIDNIEAAMTLSISDLNRLGSMTLFPNPASDFINISGGRNSNLPFELFVYDGLGKLVHQQKLMNEDSNIQLSHLNSGVYFVKVIRDKASYIKRLIKI